MKFGIYIPNLKEENPSGASFEQATLRELIKENRSHDLFVFTNGKIVGINHEGITYVNVNEYEISTLIRTVYRILSYCVLGLMRIYPSGKLKHIYFFLMKGINTTPLNRALIKNRIRLFWHTFSTEEIDIPYIYGVLDCNHWIHSYQPEFTPSSQTWSFIDTALTKIIRQATCIIASTNVLKRQITVIHGVPEEKIKVIPFFTPEISKVDSSAGAGGSVIKELPPVFLFYPARLMSQKNHVTILLALKVLKAKYGLTIPLVLAGKDGGNKRHVFSVIDELGLKDDVIYFGEVSFSNLVLLYRRAFALVYASMNGPDNFPPLEAFSLGCPVIASRLEGTHEQLGDNALFFGVTDENELAQRIYELHQNNDLRNALINRGLAKSKSWTAKHYIVELLSVVNEFDKVSRAWDDDFSYISKKWDVLMR